mmetsp:Transcript_34596/g.67333  ORF Transcript_34596/g.67333 Transcript_34596/m.67333 type:complete len:111 (-) Transcript_34596:62-394(-)
MSGGRPMCDASIWSMPRTAYMVRWRKYVWKTRVSQSLATSANWPEFEKGMLMTIRVSHRSALGVLKASRRSSGFSAPFCSDEDIIHQSRIANKIPHPRQERMHDLVNLAS